MQSSETCAEDSGQENFKKHEQLKNDAGRVTANQYIFKSELILKVFAHFQKLQVIA